MDTTEGLSRRAMAVGGLAGALAGADRGDAARKRKNRKPPLAFGMAVGAGVRGFLSPGNPGYLIEHAYSLLYPPTERIFEGTGGSFIPMTATTEEARKRVAAELAELFSNILLGEGIDVEPEQIQVTLSGL